MTKDVQQSLLNLAGANFDVKISLCRISLAQMKGMPELITKPLGCEAYAMQLLSNLFFYALISRSEVERQSTSF